jgi:hypothetical protein
VAGQKDWYLEQHARYESLFANSINSTSKHANNSNQTCENSSKVLQSISINSTTQAKPTKSSEIPDIGGYKLKISRFLGKEDEDYDVWYADLQSYFNLYQKEKNFTLLYETLVNVLKSGTVRFALLRKISVKTEKR